MRKNLFQAAPEEEAEINLTPMLDVVFIMLIFFIVTASFVKESGLDVNRPDAPTAVKKENANILVAIDQWGGPGSADINGDGIVDVEDLLAIVGAWGACP